MNTEIIIISAIVFLAALSIILGIVNWIFLSSISSKIAALEEEIEKKAKEFDTLKKEKALQKTMPIAESPGTRGSFTEQENPAIEIVRNVRAQFRQEEIGPMDSVEPQETSQAPYTGFVKQQAFSPAAQGPDRPLSNDRRGGPSADVLDVVDDAPPSMPQTGFRENEIEISLFSPAKKDTDFAAAWKKLSERLPGSPSAHVKLNFNGVMFLYEKELLYLEKIREVVVNAQGSITFINCHPELRPVIASHRSLAPCLVD
jgi:hypothetical protein